MFPTEAEVPESTRHLQLRTFLYAVLRLAFGHEATVGSDQFVYWNARDPKKCLAPDAFIRRGSPHEAFTSWKVWERGTPELAVEIVSDSDRTDEEWDDKLVRYHELGVQELVRFDPDAPEGKRLRAWDRLEGDLVERTIEGDATPCVTLGLYWVIAPVEEFAVGVRLAREADGRELLPSPVEAEAIRREEEAKLRQEETKKRQEEAKMREAETKKREAAERRVAELEAELRRRGG